jgi:chaperonin GroES
MNLNDSINSVNIANDLAEDKLIKIGNQVVQGYEADRETRKPWEKDLKQWSELALQVSKVKTFPWPNAANIKYPLLATAAMQFAARAYPTLVPSDARVVKCRIIGTDTDGTKTDRARRVSTYMSYQLLDLMEDWEEEMDKLLITLPIAGTCFKKTFWSPSKEQVVSKLVLPKNIIVDYFTRNLCEAERITEVLYLTKRKVQERINEGVFLDELKIMGDPDVGVHDEETSVNGAFQHHGDESGDEAVPYLILEQHTFLDLDDDGYAEPYIVTVDYNSKHVLRIVARFHPDGVSVNEKGKISKIKPDQYYTKYDFIPNPDGGFYSLGFGRLLGPLNESANTIINQLVDGGTLSNLQAGFIGKGLKIKAGEMRMQPGEWQVVNALGDDLKKQIFPLPTKDPSPVLFQLLELLMKSGKELASIAEIFTGKMPGQNTPATTTQATVEQGMKVFTAIYKRIYRAMTQEFRKVYALDREFMNPQEYIDILDEPIQQSDFEGPENDIVPGADPQAVSQQERQAKVQAVMQILQLGTIDPMWATQKYLEAFEIPDWQNAMKQPEQGPSPEEQKMQMEAQLKQQEAQTQQQMAQAKLHMENQSKQQEMKIKQEAAQQDLKNKQMEGILKARLAQLELQTKQAQAHVELKNNAMKGVQEMQFGEQKHQQAMKQSAEQSAAKAKATAASAKAKPRA